MTGWKVVPGTKVMYNLEVAQDHTFVVGVDEWVVHNSATGGCGGETTYSNAKSGTLQSELETADANGVKPLHAGDPGFDQMIAGGDVKYAVPAGDDVPAFVPHDVGGEEISHAVITGGGPVRVAGEAKITGSNGVYETDYVDLNSGHYQPDDSAFDVAIEAFGKAGITYKGDGL